MDAQTLLTFIDEIGSLKTLPRTGWRMRGIVDCESIADHCYRVSLMSMLVADSLVEAGIDLDADRVTRIALLHEIAEARITDIPYPAFRYLDEGSKEKAEQQAVADMLAGFGPLAERYMALWEEFSEAETLEGQIVRAVDKLELLVQVYEYERLGYRPMNRFWQNEANRRAFAKNPFTQELFEKLLEWRAALPIKPES